MGPKNRRTGRTGGLVAAAGLAAGLVFAGAPAEAAPTPARLDAVVAGLDASVRTPGTAWAVNPRTGRVDVLADDTVGGAALTRLESAVTSYGRAANLRHVSGRITPKLFSGGDPLMAGGVRCSVGFNAGYRGAPFFITAGHCAKASTTWHDLAGNAVGTNAGFTYPGQDIALVRWDSNVLQDGTVGAQDVSTTAPPTVGEPVCMRGGVSGVACGGTVTALNATVNYPDGTVTGLFETDQCAVAGDSGSPVYDANIALGVLSGSGGDCATGGVSFVQPVYQQWGVLIY